MIVVFWAYRNGRPSESGRVVLDDSGLSYPSHLASSIGWLLSKVDPSFQFRQRLNCDYSGVEFALLHKALLLAPVVFDGSRFRAQVFECEEDIPDRPVTARGDNVSVSGVKRFD